MTRFIFYWVLSFLFTASGAFSATPGQELQKALDEKSKASDAKSSPERQKIMQDAISGLKGLPGTALRTGSTLPPFALPDATGNLTTSQALLAQGNLVVTFYRGGWCPYCNLQLHAFQKVLPEIKKRNAILVALTPETPDRSLDTKQKNELEFRVLSDKDNNYARKLGLVFELPENLRKVYSEFGIDLAKNNHSEKWELPLAATYVVNQKGVVTYAFVDADYKKRANLDDVLAALSALAPKKP